MSRLAYCVLRESERPSDLLIQGVEGAAVSLTVADGLAAASSLVGEDTVVATLPRVTAYARVVEAIHAVATVLPFRYGCFVKDEAELVSLLRGRRDQFEKTLEEVRDCVEMGLRVLLDGTAAVAPHEPPRTPNAASGKAYLTGLKNHYAARDSQASAATEAAEALRLAFDGLYAKVRDRASAAGRWAAAVASFPGSPAERRPVSRSVRTAPGDPPLRRCC